MIEEASAHGGDSLQKREFTIGAPVMQRFRTVFDIDNRQLTFASPPICSATSSSSSSSSTERPVRRKPRKSPSPTDSVVRGHTRSGLEEHKLLLISSAVFLVLIVVAMCLFVRYANKHKLKTQKGSHKFKPLIAEEDNDDVEMNNNGTVL